MLIFSILVSLWFIIISLVFFYQINQDNENEPLQVFFCLTSKLVTILFFPFSFQGADELFSFDEEEIKSKLPVLPGNSTEITVTITGTHHFPQSTESSENLSYDPEAPWGLTGTIQLRYSTGESSSHTCRKATMSIDVTVVPSLLCENYQIIELPRYAKFICQSGCNPSKS